MSDHRTTPLSKLLTAQSPWLKNESGQRQCFCGLADERSLAAQTPVADSSSAIDTRCKR